MQRVRTPLFAALLLSLSSCRDEVCITPALFDTNGNPARQICVLYDAQNKEIATYVTKREYAHNVEQCDSIPAVFYECYFLSSDGHQHVPGIPATVSSKLIRYDPQNKPQQDAAVTPQAK